MDCEDLVLHLGVHPLGGYDVRVMESPAGRARARCIQPLTVNGQAAFAGAGRNIGLTPLGSGPGGPRLSPQAIGDQLFRTLFAGDVKAAFDKSLHLVAQRDRMLRLQLRIELPALADLLNLPWELLYNAELEEFLCLNRQTPFVRALNVPRSELPAVLPAALRVLAVAATIDAPSYPSLGIADELARLADAARRAGIHFEVVEDVRRASLAAALDKGRFHVLHFLGHGWFNSASGRGGLCFKAPDGTAELVDGADLAIELKGLRDLQLVFLNACNTGRIASDGAHHSPFAGAATALVLGGLPAVIAMRERIADVPAIDVSVSFYQSLLAGLPIEEAVRQGRLTLQRQRPRELAEWAIPMLFLAGRSVPMGASDEPAGAVGSGWVRGLLDRTLPRCHQLLTRRGWLREPAPDIRRYLAQQRAELQSALQGKTYLPGQARTVPTGIADRDNDAAGPVHRSIAVSIRQLSRRSGEADAVATATAQVTARTRRVRNLIQALLQAREPLVLLGDPGSGKTMALQAAMLDLIDRQARRLFPDVPIYVRLGEFHVDGPVDADRVRQLIRQAASPLVRPFLGELERDRRLILLFDGIDEMSRDRYGEHVRALNQFAGENRDSIRMLFTCRIDDFSAAFTHRRLVVLPFGPAEIAQYLRSHVNASSLLIDGRSWTAGELARYFTENEIAVDTSNPFALSLLCDHLSFEKAWPGSRMDLIESFQNRNYQRKSREAQQQWRDLPPAATCFSAWARFAYLITERSRGDAIPVQELLEQLAGDTLQTIAAGLWCGTLAPVGGGQADQVRFEHQRYREYFCALWIHQAAAQISWREKLASPPWQEAMLNLALMGGGGGGVESLAILIVDDLHSLAKIATNNGRQPASDSPAPDGAAPPPSFAEAGVPYEQEAALAELVDLAARLLQAAPTAPAVHESLRPALEETLSALVDRGRPVTQLRMMRAFRHLDDMELGQVLDQLTASPVRMVSEMALIMVNGARGGRGVGATDLATIFAYNLTANRIIDQWLTLRRAARAAGRHRNLAHLRCATAFAVLELGLLQLLAAGLFIAIVASLHAVDSKALHPAFLIGLRRLTGLQLATFQCAITGMATLVGLKRYPSSVEVYTLLSVPIGILFLVGCFSMLNGSGAAIYLLLASPFIFLAGPICAILFAPIHLLIVYLYTRLPAYLRPFRCSQAALFRMAKAELNHALDATKEDGRSLVKAATVLLPRFGFIALLFCAAASARAVSGLLGLPYHPLISEAAGASMAAIMAATAMHLIRRGSIWSIVKVMADTLIRFALAATVSIGSMYLATRFTHAVGKAVAIFAALIASLIAGRKLWDWLLLSRARRHKLTPGEDSPQEWTERLSGADPEAQMRLLAATTPESLGLSLAAFEHLLIQAERRVLAEPALSFYWKLRDQIEQALRQERIG